MNRMIAAAASIFLLALAWTGPAAAQDGDEKIFEVTLLGTGTPFPMPSPAPTMPIGPFGNKLPYI